MRLDKFLQASRIIKRRSIATTLCRRGQVTVNGHEAKAGKELAVGDILAITFDEENRLSYEIVEVPPGNVPKAKASTLYRRIDSA
jgi:ribosomal 50S subunit-recycling heat shock protein